MRSRLAALLLLIPLTTGCAYRAELELHEAKGRIAELERYIAGAQDDNAALQAHAIALTDELMAWQRGAAMQAMALEKMRRGNCEQ